MNLKISLLHDADTGLLKACAELSKLCLPSEAWSFESFRSETAKKGGFVIAALDNDRLAGFLTGSCVLDSADLTSLAVAPEYRRQGIAGILLSDFLSRLGTEVSAVFLEVRESNLPAVTFYQKHAFRKTGIRKNFYQNPDENAILMKLESE